MLLFAPVLGRPLLALPQPWLGAVAVIGTAVVVAPFADPLVELVSDPSAQFVIAAEVVTKNGTRYAATVPFITGSTDAPADTPFPDTLEGSLTFSRGLAASANGYGSYSENVSELSLINDGTYDNVDAADYVNGRSITCKIGKVISPGVVDPYNSFLLLAAQIGTTWTPKRGSLLIEHTDNSAALDVPAQPHVYQGVGGLEGATDIQGERKPYALGNAFNASPKLVVAAEGLFQYHDGSGGHVTSVKDGAIALTFYADYATTTLLRAALTTVPSPIVPGAYATCEAEGFFGLGGVAFKQITVDFTFTEQRTAELIKTLVLRSTTLTLSDFDLFTFDELNVAQPAPREYLLQDNDTVAGVLTALMNGIGGWWGLTTQGKLRVKRMELPSNIPAARYDLNGGNLVEIDRAPLPNGIDPPPRRRRITYAHNWTQQTDLYGYVSENNPSLAQYLATPYKIAPTLDGESIAIVANYPLAPDPDPILGYLINPADATAEAERQLARDTAGAKLWTAKVKNAFMIHQIGEDAFFADTTATPRLGLAAGMYAKIVDAKDDASDYSTELTVFGALQT